jgi:hypothetical protein
MIYTVETVLLNDDITTDTFQGWLNRIKFLPPYRFLSKNFGCLLLDSYLFLVWLSPRSWKWRHYVPPKRPWTYARLSGVTLQEIVVFEVYSWEIWGFRSGEDSCCSLVDYYTVLCSGRWVSTFRRNILLPSPGSKLTVEAICSFGTLAPTCKTKMPCHNPDDQRINVCSWYNYGSKCIASNDTTISE